MHLKRLKNGSYNARLAFTQVIQNMHKVASQED